MKPEPDTDTSSSHDVTPKTLEAGQEEAQRLIALAQEKGVTLRVLGGIAIQLRCPHATHRALNRNYADIDFAVQAGKQARALSPILTANGYTANRRFNALHGEKRLIFYDEPRSRQVDIFVGSFEMCHKLPLDQRLNLHPLTLSPADLLLTKLQIVQLNAKDIQDMLALLLDFPPVESSKQAGEELDVSIIAKLCGQDWGWFTTVNDNFEQIKGHASELLDAEEAALVNGRIETIQRILEKTPKSTGWRLRAMGGRRIPWYELPEEVNR
jgi:Uncharacterised nucleotidyltransferase